MCQECLPPGSPPTVQEAAGIQLGPSQQTLGRVPDECRRKLGACFGEPYSFKALSGI